MKDCILVACLADREDDSAVGYSSWSHSIEKSVGVLDDTKPRFATIGCRTPEVMKNPESRPILRDGEESPHRVGPAGSRNSVNRSIPADEGSVLRSAARSLW